MYRVIKVLNNNGVLAYDINQGKEVIVLGNGAGFGKRTGERFERPDGMKIYALVNRNKDSTVLQAVNGLDPVFLELTAKILEHAEKRFKDVNRDILLPLADHIALAVKRAREGKVLPNPFTSDIRAMFPEEFETALQAVSMIEAVCGLALPEDEAGYLTLHLHSALGEEDVAHSLEAARLVGESMAAIEESLKRKIPRDSLGYSRIITHLRYMIARTGRRESANLDMDSYARENFPESYRLAERICQRIEDRLNRPVAREEVGFLGIHIERVSSL